MDQIDTFYQQLDAEDPLNQHGHELATQARDVLRTATDAKIAGLILLPDSRDAEPFRQAIAAATGQEVPHGLMVGIVPRPMVKPLLRKRAEVEMWLEDPDQTQTVLPVVVSTRDGFKFGYFGLGAPD